MALRVGIVGWGEAARLHARFLQREGAQVAGIVSRRAAAAPFPRFAHLEELLPRVDALTLAVPNFLHARLCQQAVKAGKGVLVEKPLCLTLPELEELEQLLPRAGVTVKVGYRLRWNPALRLLRGRLRGICRIECLYRLGIERLAQGKEWTRRERESGGALFTLGVHALDLVRWLCGCQGEPAILVGTAACSRTPRQADFPLLARLHCRLPGGIELLAGADLRGNQPYHLQLRITAEKGSYPGTPLACPAPEDPRWVEDEYGGLIRDFLHSLRHRPHPQELAEILQTHRLLLQAQERLRGEGPAGPTQAPQ